MRIKTSAKITALLLCLCLLCSCATPLQSYLAASRAQASSQAVSGSSAQGTPSQTIEGRRTIPFDEMVYTRPDIEGMKERVVQLTSELANAASFDEVMRIDDEVTDIADGFFSDYTLTLIYTMQDLSDADMEEEHRILSDAEVDLTLLFNAFNEELLNSEWADEYRAEVGDYTYAAIENSLLLTSESVAEYAKERAGLVSDYAKWYEEFTVSVDGEDLNYDELISGFNTDAMNEYYDTYLDQYAQYVARLVELDKLTAEELGFASAAEMYYISNNRNYTPADARALCDDILENFAPLLMGLPGSANPVPQIDLQAALNEAPSAFRLINPELEEVFNQMIDFGLCDLEPRPGKTTSMQFATYIYNYDAPFMFINWDGSINSTTTLVHEFGHFYSMWVNIRSISESPDISEVYSQGLELIALPFYDNLVDNVEDMELEYISGLIINGFIFQSALEEFQLELYELDNITAESLSKLYGDIMAKYYLGLPNTPDHDWLRIASILDMPFYTMGYVTSALAATQLWAISKSDWNAAADMYMDLIYANKDQDFDDVFQDVGLVSVFSQEAITIVTGALEEFFVSYE